VTIVTFVLLLAMAVYLLAALTGLHAAALPLIHALQYGTEEAKLRSR
jgi:hypothetical protein